MTSLPGRSPPDTHVESDERPHADRRERLSRIAVGVGGHPEGRDAVALGAALGGITRAELILIAVTGHPQIARPSETHRKALREATEEALAELEARLAPGARTVAESDDSVPRGLQRVVEREHGDLLVVGSSRHGHEGQVRIGKRARELLSFCEFPLAVAPRDLGARAPITVRNVGVGFDGSAESEAALALADSIATTAGATLRLRGVVDDRLPMLLRSSLKGLVSVLWSESVETLEQQLAVTGEAAVQECQAAATFELSKGRPADALLALSHEVDLLVVGSRRWGPAARVLLGSTGEAICHEAACAVVAVPRPDISSALEAAPRG